MAPARSTRLSNNNSANIGFEQKLWLAADKLRSNMDAAEYKHVVLGLIFLKYISDSFEEHHAKLLAGEGDYAGANPEDPDEYKAENVFWVPPDARWTYLQNSAKQPTIGKIVDDAMVAIERDNPRLKGILPKDYARPSLDKNRLGELVDLIGTIELIPREAQNLESAGASPAQIGAPADLPLAAETPSRPYGTKDKQHRSKDILGRVYEYFLSRFASAEGKKGGQFYTPQSVVRLLVEMLAPYKGRIYDPCCGSGGMFVQSEKFVEAHGGRLGDISIYGQESNATTRRLAMMNLAIRGIEADLGEEQADTFRRDLHPDLRADFVLANPPFNDSDWFRKDDDARWQFGLPPRGNANFAWVQHFIYHLAPTGMAGFVLANGSMSSNQSGEGEIRRAIIEADLVDCMVALPGQLFYSTQIPVCLWFLRKNKAAGANENQLGPASCTPRVAAKAIRVFQAVKAALAKKRGERRSTEDLDHAVRQLVAKAIAPEGEIIDVFQAAGLKQPDISILSDQFLAEVRGLKHKNVAAELLAKLLGDEIKTRSKRNLVQGREFSEMLKKTLNAYHNRAIATQEVIEELIKLAKQLSEADLRGQELGLNDNEYAFYTALAKNNSAVEVMGQDSLKVIATELVTRVRKSVTIDWTLRESARAKIKVLVKRILRKHGYPPDLQDEATKLVLQQAELLCAEWAA